MKKKLAAAVDFCDIHCCKFLALTSATSNRGKDNCIVMLERLRQDKCSIAMLKYCGLQIFNPYYPPSRRYYNFDSDVCNVTHCSRYFNCQCKFVHVFPGFIFICFFALCKDGNNMSSTFQLSVLGGNIFVTSILAPTSSASGHIQTLVPAVTVKFFCLAQDFYFILGLHSLKSVL
jgi:hypothetical protein